MAEPSQASFTNRNDDDVTLKDIIFIVREYLGEILRNWRIIVLVTVPFLIITLTNAFISPKKFNGDLTFMVNEDEGSQLGGVATVLEDIGLGGASTNSEYNLDKILELMKSHRIINLTLMEKATIKGKEDYLSNHMIEIYNLDKEWRRKKKKLVGFRFTRDSLENFNRKEHMALNYLHKKLIKGVKGPPIVNSTIAESSGIMTISVASLSEPWSVEFLNKLYIKLSAFYIDQTTKKQRLIYETVHEQTDSIRGVLKAKEYELAKFMDNNQFLVPNVAQLRKAQLERDVFVLNTMYGEAVKNEETAKFTLKNKTPFVQAIDTPVAPLKVEQKSKIKAVVLAIILGILFSSIFIVVRKAYREAMEE